MKNNNTRLYKIIRKLLVAFAWIIIWQLAYMLVNQEILIASPLAVFQRLLKMIYNVDFWLITLSSIGRILKGFLLAVAVGTIMSILTTSIPLLYEFFYPAISVIKATPITSFIILALVWIRSYNVPSFMAFLMVLPVIWGNVTEGIKNTDKNLLEMADVYKIGLLKKVKYIYIPSVLPYFISAFKTGLGFSWKAGIAAEVIGRPGRSIGDMIQDSKIYLETVDLFSWTLVIIILSIIIEKFLVKLLSSISEKYILRK